MRAVWCHAEIAVRPCSLPPRQRKANRESWSFDRLPRHRASNEPIDSFAFAIRQRKFVLRIILIIFHLIFPYAVNPLIFLSNNSFMIARIYRISYFFYIAYNKILVCVTYRLLSLKTINLSITPVCYISMHERKKYCKKYLPSKINVELRWMNSRKSRDRWDKNVYIIGW